MTVEVTDLNFRGFYYQLTMEPLICYIIAQGAWYLVVAY